MKKPTKRNKKGNILHDNKWDYRFIPFGFVVIYALIFLFSDIFLGGKAVIGEYLSTGAYNIHFNDLWTLLSGVDSIRDGMNPYTDSGNPWGGDSCNYNYPITWGFLVILPFFTSSNHIYIGCGLALAVFIALYFFMGRINRHDSICYTLMLLSPAVLFGFERGNCDLIILLFLLIPIFYKKSKGVLAFFILVTSVLKLFPIGAVLSILNSAKNKTKKLLLLTILVGVLFIVYLVLMKENISLVSEKTPRPFGSWSYGLGGIPSITFRMLQASKTLIFGIYIILTITGFIFFYRFTQKKFKFLLINSGKNGMSFLIGSGIFITTCLVGYNWEYRLVFLLLTFPQILSWIAEKKSLAKDMLILTIIIVWFHLFFTYSGETRYFYSFYQIPWRLLVFIRHLLEILLFYHHLVIVINFLISYYKKSAPIIFPFIKRETKYSNTEQ